jgi:predicted CopG family antitoxin
VLTLTKYATISVPADIKNLLEKAKGKKEWGEFILNLYTETQRLKRKKAFRELTEILTEKELKTITESSKEFRERFAFR